MNSPNPSEDLPVRCSEIDEAASELIDRVESHPNWEQLSEDERRKVVDLVWLDSLLHQSQNQRQFSTTTNQAIDRVLARLRTELPVDAKTEPAVNPVTVAADAHRRSSNRHSWRSRLTVAAVLLMVAIGWWQSQPQSAKAMFDQALEAALTQDDRVYQVTVTPFGANTPPRKGRLTVRGGEKFVFERTGPLGGVLAIGGNGKEFWFAPPIGAVLVANSEDVVPEWSQKPDLNMPFLQITTILRRMRDAYRLTQQPSESISGHDGTLNHLVADRRRLLRGRFGLAPSKIELWTAPETGIVHRLVAYWSTENNSRPFDQVELELTKETPATEEIYEYSHYAAGRPIRTVPPSQ